MEQGPERLLVQTLLCSEHTLWEASGGSSSALLSASLSLSKQNQHKQDSPGVCSSEGSSD